jgi:putative transposase
MIYSSSRISWDTNVKHYIRNGLFDNLPNTIKAKIPKTNKHRWERETADKYLGCEVANFIKEELELIKRTGESKNAKKVMEAYFKLSDTCHEIISAVKGIKRQMGLQKEKLVNAVEMVKDIVPVESALKVFNISRATYHNHKVLVINKCDSSYFLLCVKQYPHQLLKKEILQIKKYMENEDYVHWSKSSVYLLALFAAIVKCHSTAIKIWSTFKNFDGCRKNKKACKFKNLQAFKGFRDILCVFDNFEKLALNCPSGVAGNRT